MKDDRRRREDVAIVIEAADASLLMDRRTEESRLCAGQHSDVLAVEFAG